MAVVKGFLSLAAMKKSTTWGTPVACGAGNGIEFLTESISGGPALIENNMLSGDSQRRAGTAGPKSYAGSIEGDLVFEEIGLPLALAMGTEATTGTAAPYTHTLKVLDDVEGLFATLALKADAVEVHEYPSVKVNGFEISAAPGEPAKVKLDLIASTLNRNTAAGTNTLTTMGSVTFPTDRERALFSQVKVQYNAQGGAALASPANDLAVEGVTVTFARNLQGKVTSALGLAIDEPQPTDFVSVTGSLVLPYWNAAALAIQALAESKAEQKVKVEFTAASGGKKLTLWLNAVQFEGKPSLNGPGAGNVTYNFTAHAVATAPTGFPTNGVDALTVELATASSALYLA